MSDPVFPQEIVDSILDLLHHEPETLKQCCLVSKSWVPRTRRYLFANIGFYSPLTLKLWNQTFPDPTTSPASYVSTLSVDCDLRDVEGTDWIRTFSHIIELRLHDHPMLPFPLFHGLSQNLKSLYVRNTMFSYSELFNLICSFPLLENLYLVGEETLENENDVGGLRTVSPPLTGSLRLMVFGGMGSVPRHLLSLPNGLRFRQLRFLFVPEKDLRWINELVLKCSDTLECLDVKYIWSGTSDPIDLSKATKLKELIFRLRTLWPGRVITMLETITPEHRDFGQISIYLPFRRIPRDRVHVCLGLDTYNKWLELDRLLVRFWESRSIRPRVVITESMRGIRMKDRIRYLFPEVMARGIIDLAEEY